MLVRSARFDDAVRYGGSVDYRVYVQRIDPATGAASILADLLTIVGSPAVDVDTTAASRRAISSITIADPDGSLAGTINDPLSPYGSELVIETGFVWPDAAPERVSLGVFRITSAVPDGRGSVVIAGTDRSIVIRENEFDVPYVIAAGSNIVTAAVALLQSRYPGLVVNATPTTMTVPSTIVYLEGSHSGDPAKNCDDLLAAAGMEWFIDASGAGVIRPVPDPATTPAVWDYQPGTTSTLYIDGRNELNALGVRNKAVVVGEGPGVPMPVRSVRTITDVSSPIHPARIGTKPVFLTSPLITTQTQADAAALALLLRKAGGSEHFQLTAAPHPAHDGGDVVHAADPDLDLDANVVLTKFAIPVLFDGPINYTTAARRSA